VQRVERERRPVVTAVRPQRTVERVAPAPRRTVVTQRVERAPQRTVRPAASRRPAVTRVERRTVVTHRGPQPSTRQMAPAPGRRHQPQLNRGHERRQAVNLQQRPARQKSDRRNAGG
jgi:hypothetical protein